MTVSDIVILAARRLIGVSIRETALLEHTATTYGCLTVIRRVLHGFHHSRLVTCRAPLRGPLDIQFLVSPIAQYQFPGVGVPSPISFVLLHGLGSIDCNAS